MTRDELEQLAGIGSWTVLDDDPSPRWSDNLFRLLGYEPGEVAPGLEPVLARAHPDDREAIRDGLTRAARETGRVVRFRVTMPDGARRRLVMRTRRAGQQRGRARIVGWLTDVTEETARARALEEATNALDAAQQIANVGSWTWDPESGEIHWSDQLYRITGVDPEVVPTVETFDGLIHPEDLPRLHEERVEVLSGADPARSVTTLRLVRPDGSIRWIEMLARHSPGGELVGAIIDITERRRLEEQLRSARTLEAIGRLAAGIAHDFNNLLMVILANAAALETGEGRRELQEIQAAAESGASLVRRLLAFGAQTPGETRALDLSLLVTDAAAWIQRVIGDDIVVVCSVDPGLYVRADPSEVHRVLLNLANNCRDAMPDGGTLQLSLQRDADEAELRVVDDGEGMDQATLEHALEPFFTTKQTGEGTGLGLSSVYGTVERMGGSFRIDSSPGVGTEVVIRLPTVEALAREPASSAPPTAVRRLDARVLLVEDETYVRRALSRHLRRAGADVIEAGDAQDALLVLAETSDVDVIVTDWMMPGGGGRAVIDELEARDRRVPVVVMSGYMPDPAQHEGVVLLKPFPPEELIAHLVALTDEPRPG